MALDSGLVPAPLDFAYQREAELFGVTWQGEPAVLRRIVQKVDDRDEKVLADRRWVHEFLSALAPSGFPAPRPLPAFGGQSVVLHEGDVWELVSFVPGRSVEWAGPPLLESIGQLMARYHEVAQTFRPAAQRPGALDAQGTVEVLIANDIDSADIYGGELPRALELALVLADELDRLGPQEELVIHGDFTTNNVVVEGEPPLATGVIDFALAHWEAAEAELGYGLWQSGRPQRGAPSLQQERVVALVRGYGRARRLRPQAARAVPVYAMGRGLQMMAKRVRQGAPWGASLDQVAWTAAHLDDLERALTPLVG